MQEPIAAPPRRFYGQNAESNWGLPVEVKTVKIGERPRSKGKTKKVVDNRTD